MPLSEHEQRLLDEMEHALSVEDPKFASQMRGVPGFPKLRKRALLGAAGFGAGIALVVIGIMSMWWIGIVGFVVMVASGAYAFAPSRTLGVVDANGQVRPTSGSRRKSAASPAPRSGGFMERLERRWERRRHEGF